MKLNRLPFLVGLALTSICLFTSAKAGIINGSFENGLLNWVPAGPNSSVASGTINGAASTDGVSHAYLNNGSGAFSLLIQDLILTGAGIPAGYIASVDAAATEGSTLFQTFTLNAGNNAINFDWNFLTDEAANEVDFNDFAFALLYDNTNAMVAGTAGLDTNSGLVNVFSDFERQTGWQSVAMGGLTAGNSYTLVFGVFDRTDNAFDSGLLVDNVRSVPEPGAALSIILAGVLVSGLRRRFVG